MLLGRVHIIHGFNQNPLLSTIKLASPVLSNQLHGVLSSTGTEIQGAGFWQDLGAGLKRFGRSVLQGFKTAAPVLREIAAVAAPIALEVGKSALQSEIKKGTFGKKESSKKISSQLLEAGNSLANRGITALGKPKTDVGQIASSLGNIIQSGVRAREPEVSGDGLRKRYRKIVGRGLVPLY